MNYSIRSNELQITWDEKGEYHSEITFIWRGILIFMNIDVCKSWGSRTDTITIFVNGEETSFGWGRATIGKGQIGRQPTIESGAHFLKIKQHENIVNIMDLLKEGHDPVVEESQIFQVID